MIFSPGMKLEDMERYCILKTFDHFQRNKTVTANALGICIRTLDNKLAKYKSDDDQHTIDAEQRRIEREAFRDRQRGIAPQVASPELVVKTPEPVDEWGEPTDQWHQPTPEQPAKPKGKGRR